MGIPAKKSLFQPIAGERIHERVADQIVYAIRSGAFKVGSRLPSVEEMARQMDVSKPTVGQAIRLLSDHGILKARRGVKGGVTVVGDDIPVSLLSLPDRREPSLRELLEARRPVEMEIARLAGQRAEQRDLAEMREAIAELRERTQGDAEMRLHFDHLFHYAMGRAARSEVLAFLQHQILEGITVVLHDYFVLEEDPVQVADLHARTLEAIESNDSAQIDRVMDEHLAYLERVSEQRVASKQREPKA
jgi:GntR family transcriptional repressor for pyruvate dehydrogenase complex